MARRSVLDDRGEETSRKSTAPIWGHVDRKTWWLIGLTAARREPVWKAQGRRRDARTRRARCPKCSLGGRRRFVHPRSDRQEPSSSDESRLEFIARQILDERVNHQEGYSMKRLHQRAESYFSRMRRGEWGIIIISRRLFRPICQEAAGAKIIAVSATASGHGVIGLAMALGHRSIFAVLDAAAA